MCWEEEHRGRRARKREKERLGREFRYRKVEDDRLEVGRLAFEDSKEEAFRMLGVGERKGEEKQGWKRDRFWMSPSSFVFQMFTGSAKAEEIRDRFSIRVYYGEGKREPMLRKKRVADGLKGRNRELDRFKSESSLTCYPLPSPITPVQTLSS